MTFVLLWVAYGAGFAAGSWWAARRLTRLEERRADEMWQSIKEQLLRERVLFDTATRRARELPLRLRRIAHARMN